MRAPVSVLGCLGVSCMKWPQPLWLYEAASLPFPAASSSDASQLAELSVGAAEVLEEIRKWTDEKGTPPQRAVSLPLVAAATLPL